MFNMFSMFKIMQVADANHLASLQRTLQPQIQDQRWGGLLCEHLSLPWSALLLLLLLQ
jgi:hypothetical protein